MLQAVLTIPLSGSKALMSCRADAYPMVNPVLQAHAALGAKAALPLLQPEAVAITADAGVSRPLDAPSQARIAADAYPCIGVRFAGLLHLGRPAATLGIPAGPRALSHALDLVPQAVSGLWTRGLLQGHGRAVHAPSGCRPCVRAVCVGYLNTHFRSACLSSRKA